MWSNSTAAPPGKLHTPTAQDLPKLYARFDQFCALRSSVDPLGRFGNDHLDAVLGAAS
ncbi:MAG: D-arabinono-1,4-lactone oxidase [Sciscionella sp.]